MIKVFLVSFLFSASAMAAIVAKTVSYTVGTVQMQSEMYFDDNITEKKPGILVMHDWLGINNFTKGKAKKLAEMGYVAMAVDIFGVGNYPKNVKESGALQIKYKDDRPLMRAHVKAAYDALIASGKVDPKRILASGYSLGGTTALELARSGAALVGTASFNGGLSTPHPEDAKNIKGRVLIMHGGEDHCVPAEEVTAFKKEMADAKVNMKFVTYPGVVHAFSVPTSGSDKSKGFAYDKKADEDSWQEFTNFIKEIFQPQTIANY